MHAARTRPGLHCGMVCGTHADAMPCRPDTALLRARVCQALPSYYAASSMQRPATGVGRLPGRCGPVGVVDTTPTAVTVAWKRPSFDGRLRCVACGRRGSVDMHMLLRVVRALGATAVRDVRRPRRRGFHVLFDGGVPRRYHVQYTPKFLGTWIDVADAVQGTRCTVARLNPGDRYVVRVRAGNDAGGWGAFSYTAGDVWTRNAGSCMPSCHQCPPLLSLSSRTTDVTCGVCVGDLGRCRRLTATPATGTFGLRCDVGANGSARRCVGV
jgi:hypothetical protein